MTRLHRHRRRLERRRTQECILDLNLLKTLDVLHLLHRLGSDTKEKFYTSQILRSHSASVEVLHLLWPQHFHIDEPWRSRASSQLKLIFRFRNLMIPPTQDTLRLFRQFLRQWTPTFSPQCIWHRIRPDFARHPDSEIFPGLLLSEANLQDTVWPDERDYLNHSVTQLERWLRAWNLPTRLQVERQHFFRQEWYLQPHHQSTNPTGWSLPEIQAFRRYPKALWSHLATISGTQQCSLALATTTTSCTRPSFPLPPLPHLSSNHYAMVST